MVNQAFSLSFSFFLANLKMQVQPAPIQLAFSIKPDMAAAGIPSPSSGVFFANVLKELLKVSSHYSLALLYPMMAKGSLKMKTYLLI